jgi:hypothetical protein
MTPKEKAIELFDKYYRLFNNFPNYQYVIENINTIQDEKLYTTKQCALIAVDEIINLLGPSRFLSPELTLGYWLKVKQEIESL